VEHDEDDYILVRGLLAEIEGRRFNLEWVASYRAALEAIHRKRHDVYLVDYRLGAHNGLEFMREAAERGCRAPMILLTGQGGREIDVEAMRAGAADYLSKGEMNSVILERSIRYALDRARTLEALRRSEEQFRAIVEMALSGAEALKRFAPGRYDMVLIDLGMPEMPGDQVAREMKRLDASVVTVLITGWELGEADPRLSRFDFHVRKPFEDIDRVQNALAQAMELHDARIAGRAG
jgi:CheY-like chemotaxis protein